MRAALSTADRYRRERAAASTIWRVAPGIAALALALALLRRWTLWSAWLPLAVLLAGALVLGLVTVLSRRAREVPDETAAIIDGDAALNGELRSASWFARRESRDTWADLHLERAASRLEAVQWDTLYARPSAARARVVTAVLAVAAVALTLIVPPRAGAVRRGTAAGAATAAPDAAPGPAEPLPPELLAQLQALLAAASTGDLPEAERLATSAELRDLLNRLAADPELLKKLAAALAAADPKKQATTEQLQEMAARARHAAEMAAMSQDMRDALEKMADEVEEAVGQETAADKTGEAGGEGPQRGDAGQSNAPGAMQELSLQVARQPETGGGSGIMMMSSPDDQGNGPPGSGVGGSGAQDSSAAAAAAALAAAFTHEMVEASQDSAGENVESELRRKTEQGTSQVAFTGSAAAAFDTSRASAPPAVPEARRSGVQTYFIRKQ